MFALSVNLNKVALLRNQRPLNVPSVTRSAQLALFAGCHGITVHPRPDERHIRPEDVRHLSDLVQNWSSAPYSQDEAVATLGTSGHVDFSERTISAPHKPELNVEGNPLFEDFVDLVIEVGPHQCTLVPDSVDQATSDHGWDLTAKASQLAPLIETIKKKGIRVSLFVDPDPATIEKAAHLGADRVELYTESWARAFGTPNEATVLDLYRRCSVRARECGLGVNAGHDLNLRNVGKLVRICQVDEVSIGHALIAEALESGLYGAVRAYLRILAAESA